ncbi:nitric oxide reductase transcriptional regulator NorR [Celerinatantimonas sp. MCCC 1A17872]|uniref:nitric oxide reductase transcriptional regulator NorR n=1 Tax=Celerinatantimonas sp. MCCC 1A17872 TaxID=3177514 RepID=UPI0038C5E6E7
MLESIEQLLLNISLMLSKDLTSDTTYQTLIDAIKQVFPCDACALFILDEHQALIPVASSGLQKERLSQRFYLAQHPRLEAILNSREPVRFSASCPLPDPFDGLLENSEPLNIVHSCMGCSLYVEQLLVGALTLDAQAAGKFDQIDDITVQTVAALAAATLHNRRQFERLSRANQHQRTMTRLLIKNEHAKAPQLTGQTLVMNELRSNVDLVANSSLTVLISGETGTGKELVANRIHERSARNDQPLIRVNCAALPEQLAESELFGHVKGAFTGAINARSGKFELADQGTLFLDEVGELSLNLQAKLLRVIQQGELQRIGSDVVKIIDVRLIAATNRDLQQEVAAGRFRSDLYHRLAIFPVHVPPLRERLDDLPLLCDALIKRLTVQFHCQPLTLGDAALKQLHSYSWPGNIRELEHILTRAALKTLGQAQSVIHRGVLDFPLKGRDSMHPSVQTLPLKEAMQCYQRQLIERALTNNHGVWAKAARELGMDRGNLYRLGQKLGLT